MTYTVKLFFWLFLCIGVSLVICYRMKLTKYGRLGIGCLAVIAFLTGSKLIKVDTLSDEVLHMIDTTLNESEKSYLKVSEDNIQILINNKWVDLADIKIIGSLLADDVYIRYDNHDIYLGHSGVVNTLRVLKSLGLID